ncbi:hypothetical protein OF830_25130 [Bacillus paramycoides]|uniref:hypothetical protein n=1 Tax=Bacillus paramycoides TaxID=2026194 RepID=UPI002243764C|nr:hypothetical protein [Bacillus paramycoides]MCW9134088.1 hypothetical protein [Bacillus paramycoides]
MKPNIKFIIYLIATALMFCSAIIGVKNQTGLWWLWPILFVILLIGVPIEYKKSRK